MEQEAAISARIRWPREAGEQVYAKTHVSPVFHYRYPCSAYNA